MREADVGFLRQRRTDLGFGAAQVAALDRDDAERVACRRHAGVVGERLLKGGSAFARLPVSTYSSPSW